MDIRVTIEPPLYDEKVNKKNGTVRKTMKEQCRKNHLLRLRIKGVDQKCSQKVFDYIMARLCASCGVTKLVSLSECDWGRPSEFLSDTNTLIDSICVPKDYDHLEEQKKELVKMVKDIIRDMRENNIVVVPQRV